jgi:MoaA/NifB/PqqE/SkfB family radical SAM enzyme
MKKILQASPYFWEKVKGKNLGERHKRRKLSFMLLNQAPACDSHCKRCFMPNERRKLAESETALKLEEWKGLIDEGKRRGLLSIEISGEGEPLLSANTIPIIKHANSSGILATLITNGHALTEETIKILLDEKATLIFSLHSLDPKRYEEDNGCPDSFRQKMKAIESAARIFSGITYPENNYLVQRLAIHATLQADNLDEIDNLKFFCHERDMFFSIAPLANSGNAMYHPELQVDRDITEITEFGDNSIIHSESSVKIHGREVCGTCAFGMSIGFDGNLLLDAHGGYEIEDMFGNVGRHSFDKLYENWHSFVEELFRETKGFCPVRDEFGFQRFIGKSSSRT